MDEYIFVHINAAASVEPLGHVMHGCGLVSTIYEACSRWEHAYPCVNQEANAISLLTPYAALRVDLMASSVFPMYTVLQPCPLT